MLGEKLGSMTATSVTKVLPSDGTLPKFEVTAQGSGTITGVPVQFMGTYQTDLQGIQSNWIPPFLHTTPPTDS